MRVASTTRPNWAKNSLNSWSVVSWLTPPTKILLVFSCSSLGIARLGSIYSDKYKLECTADLTAKEKTYNLSIEEMFLDHDDINSLGILECEEAKAS